MTLDDTPRIDWKGRAVLMGFILGATGVALTIFFYAIHWLRARHAPQWQLMGATLVYMVVILGIVFLARLRAKRFTDIRFSPAMKRFQRRIMALTLVYTVAVFAAVFGFMQFHPTGPLAYVIALIPAIPAAGFFLATGRYRREETDEFWRNLQIEASQMAMGGAMIVACAWGFLEIFRLVPHVPAIFVAPLYALLYGPSLMIVHRRYQ